MDPTQRQRKTLLAVNAGLVANVLLAVSKTTVGIVGHSSALLADGINSTSDVAYYVVVRVFVGLAHKPADEEHPYGHSQLESIAALVVGAFVVTTAMAIFWGSVNKVYDLWSSGGADAVASPLALVVAVLTVALKSVLTVATRRIARQTGNPAVLALAYDHRNDVFAASAASVGILLARHGQLWVDPLAGAIVALVVLRTGIEILRESSSELMDTSPGRELSEQIVAWLADVPGVEQVQEIHVHRFGPYLLVNVTVCIDGTLTVAEGDEIATAVERKLLAEHAFVRRVHVHYHPAQPPAA